MNFEIQIGPDFMPIAQKLVDMDQPLPNPNMPFFAFSAMNDQGEVKGFAVLSCVALIEPFHVEEGGMLSARLFRFIENYLRSEGVHRVIVHSSDPLMQKMILRAGARPISDPCFELRAEWMEES